FWIIRVLAVCNFIILLIILKPLCFPPSSMEPGWSVVVFNGGMGFAKREKFPTRERMGRSCCRSFALLAFQTELPWSRASATV
ncbi:hypothetical protein HN51_054835, partial [Arachis hypogaea]